MPDETGSYSTTKLLIIANVLVFELVFSMPAQMMEWVFSTFSFSAAHLLDPARWLGSMFLHASASHLFFNMVGLYFFGKAVESKAGRRWFVAVYFLSGILGSLAFALTNTGEAVGASGAVFGLMGAAMLLDPLRRVNFYIFPLPLGIVAVVFAAAETTMAFAAVSSQIAHVTHVAGLATGAVLAFLCCPKKSLKGILLLALLVLLLIALLPLFSIVMDIGSMVLGFVDAAAGFVLYGIAKLLSFIWL